MPLEDWVSLLPRNGALKGIKGLGTPPHTIKECPRIKDSDKETQLVCSHSLGTGLKASSLVYQDKVGPFNQSYLQ